MTNVSARKIMVGVILMFLALSGAKAEDRLTDTLHLKGSFRRGQTAVDASFGDNRAALSSFRSAMRERLASPQYTLDGILIRTGSSPDGNTKLNKELSEQRAQSLLRYLSNSLSIGKNSFRLNAVGEDWGALATAVEKLPQPWASSALDIIRNTPIWVRDDSGKIVDGRKNRLRYYSHGEAWAYLNEHVFDDVCSVGTVQAIFRHDPDAPELQAPEPHTPDAQATDTTIDSLRRSLLTTVSGQTRPETRETEAPRPTGDHRLSDYMNWAAPGALRTVLEVQFRLDKTDIDYDFAGNRERIRDFLDDFEAVYAGINPESIQIDIYAGASPEGAADHNFDLGAGRCAAISALLRDSLGDKAGNIVTHNLAARWNDLYDAVAASNESWRDEVLAIIRLKPSANHHERDHREAKLRNLKGGTVWPELLSGYLAPLRSGGSAVVSYRPEADTTAPAPQIPAPATILPQQSDPIKDTLFLIEDKALARKNCVAIPLRRTGNLTPCPTRIALSPEYLSTLSALVRDTLEIRFRLDSTRIDASFAGNRYRIGRFMDAINHRYAGISPSAMRLDIYAGASPEGSADHNRWLGQERGASIRRLIRDSLGIRVGNIQVHNLAARWDDFYDAVAASNEPWKNEVLAIIRKEPSRDTKSRDHRELELRSLHGGTVWPDLLDRYLAPLRSGGSAVLTIDPSFNPYAATDPGANSPCGDAGWQFAGDTLWICGGTYPAPQKDTVFMMQNTPYGMYPYDQYPWPVVPEGYYIDDNGKLRRQKVKKVVVPADKTPAWAVKTNLLFWGVVAPNVQVEVPLGWRNRWSLEYEYDHPWFIWSTNSHASQILNMSLELRYYLGNRDFHRWLDGWHLGIAFGGGKYDWEWTRHEGWQGEFINTYFNVGFQHRFGKHWAVDAGLGIGIMPSKYRHYYGGSVYPDNHLEPWDIHLIWHDTGHFVFPATTHLNVSISYMFNNWPFHLRTMSPRKQQEWHDEYYRRIDAEKARKEARQAEHDRKANERDLKAESKKAAKAATKPRRNNKKTNNK